MQPSDENRDWGSQKWPRGGALKRTYKLEWSWGEAETNYKKWTYLRKRDSQIERLVVKLWLGRVDMSLIKIEHKITKPQKRIRKKLAKDDQAFIKGDTMRGFVG